jgi:hypothetical protein
VAVAGTATAGAVAVVVGRGVRAGRSGRSGNREALTVTVNRPPEALADRDAWPAELQELAADGGISLEPAPGDRGTVLRLVPAAGESGSDGPDRARLRAALREVKQLIEVGEVLQLDPAPHGRRTPTPTGALLEFATRRAGSEGLL